MICPISGAELQIILSCSCLAGERLKAGDVHLCALLPHRLRHTISIPPASSDSVAGSGMGVGVARKPCRPLPSM